MKRCFMVGMAVVGLALPVLGQPDRGPGGGPGFMGRGPGASLLGLVGLDPVRTELKLSDEQKAAVDEIIAAERGAARPDPAAVQDLSEEERRARFEHMRREHEEKVRGLLTKVLKPEQLDRLMQIHLQNLGVAGLVRPDVIERLALTAEQKEKLPALIEARSTNLREAMRAMFEDAGGDFSGMREKMEELRKQEDDKVLAALTDEQRATFEKLKGEPFEMPRFGRGPGGRGPGGGPPDDGR